jgi:ribosomal-protein-alanine N-acetyltransferase
MSGQEVLRYFPNTDPPARDQVERLIQGQLKHWKQHGYGWWAVCAADLAVDAAQLPSVPPSAPLIGWAGLQYLPETDETEVGYLLDRGYWGRGLATEAARTSVQFGFEYLGMKTIVGIVHPENIASQRVLEKAGLAYVERAHYFGMDVYRYLTTRSP